MSTLLYLILYKIPKLLIMRYESGLVGHDSDSAQYERDCVPIL